MKKKYEKVDNLIIISWLFLFIVLVIGWIILKEKIYSYKKYSGVLYTDEILEVILSKDDTKLLQRNKEVYILNKKYNIKVSRVEEDILKRDGKKLNQVFLDFSKDLGTTGDVVEFTVIKRRIKGINVFKIIWEGDNNS